MNFFQNSNISHKWKGNVVVQFKYEITAGLFLCVYLVVFLIFLRQFFLPNYTVWATLAFSVYVIRPDNSNKRSRKYMILASVFVIAAFFTGVKTFYFLAIGLSMLYAIESYIGSVGFLPFFLVGLLTPTLNYFNNIMGFPVRLKLSQWAGQILQLLGYKIKVTGNMLLLNGSEFSVDPACMGLKMMAVSLLAGIIIMAFYERQGNRQFSFWGAAVVLIVITVFNILANMIRILILVIFKILPENPMHDIIGVLTLAFYVIIPTWFFVKLVHRKAGQSKTVANKPTKPGRLGYNFILIAIVLLTGFTRFNNVEPLTDEIPDVTLQGYSKKLVKGDVLKFEKPGVLIYIKPLQKFYGSEHNPMICWVGSGYKFKMVTKKHIANKDVYTGILKKGNDKLYAAWWFDNGHYQTIQQGDWRWRSLKGENFYLVNVNAESESVMINEVNNLLITDK